MAKQLNVNLAFNADIGKAKTQIQELQTLLSKVAFPDSSKSNSMSKEMLEASEAAKELQVHLNNAFNAKTGQFDLSSLDKSLRNSQSNLQDLSLKLINAGDVGQQTFMKLAQSISLADQPMLKINSKLKEFATTMKNTVRWQLSSSMLHGFMGAMQSAYGYAQDLNESLTNIRIVTGQNADEMANFAIQANKAAKALSTTTTDYTNASLIYFQQGLSAEEVNARTEVTIKMANAAGQSASVVADQMTAVWNNFYDGSKSLEYYADVMTALGAATASSTDEIAGGLEKFAAIGDTIGLSYEYAASALATITSNTRQSEEVVGTALKTIFARIQGLKLGETLDDGTSLNKYSAALQQVGINIFDATGQLKNMDNILDEMGAKWETLNKQQQVALAQTVAGTRQYTQLVALMDNWDNGDSDSMKANLDTAYNASGSLDKQADIYAESWEAAEKRVRAAAEGIYQNLLDDKFFIGLNNALAEVLGGIDLFIDKAGGLKSVIIALSSVLLASFSSKIPTVLNNLSHNFTIVKDNLKAMTDLSGKFTIPDQYVKTLKDLESASNELFTTHNIDKDSSLGYMVTSSNELAVARSKLTSISDKMTDSEKQLAEMELSMAQSYQEEVYALKQRNEELEESIALQKESLSNDDIGSAYVNKAYKQEENMANRYGAMVNDKDALAGDQVGLEKFKGVYSELIDNLSTSIGGMGDQLVEAFISGSQEAQNLTEHLKPVADAANTIKTNLKDLSLDEAKAQVIALKEVIPESVREASGLEKVFHEIAIATNEQELSEGVDHLVASLEDCNIPASKLKQVLAGLYGGAKIDKLDKEVKELIKNTEKATNKMNQFKKALQGFSPNHVVRVSEALGSLASLAGSAVTIVNLLSSAVKTLADPDASGWEKLSSILMVVASGIPTVLTSFKSLSTIITFLNQQYAALGIITNTSTAAQQKAALVVTLQKTAYTGLIGAMTQEQAIAIASLLTKEALTNKNREATIAALTLQLQNMGLATSETAVAVATAMVTTAQNQQTVSGLKALKAKAANMAADTAHNGIRLTGIILQTILNALTGDWVSILKVVGVVIAMLVGGLFIAWLDQIIVTEKEAMQALEDNAEHSKQAFENLQTSIQETADALKSIEEQKSALENMTAGTEEWYMAVSKLNAEVMSLVEKFPFLQAFVVQTDGVLGITEQGIQKLNEYQNKRYQAANNLKISDEIALKNAQVESDKNDLFNENLLFGTETAQALIDAYKNPMVGDQMFTREGANAIFDTLVEAESQLGEQGDALWLSDSIDYIKSNAELYKVVQEDFYNQLKDSEEIIKNAANTQAYLQELENSQMANVLNTFGTNRTVDEVNQMIGADYSMIRDAKKDEISTAFGDWNDRIDYDEDDSEWDMIKDFMSTKGDNVKYVAQRKHKMVLEIDGEEFEYSKDEVYNALAELYTSDEIKTRLCTSLTETLGDALTGVDLTQLDTSQIFQLDNLIMDFENALASSGLKDKANDIMNQIIAQSGGDTAGLTDFLSMMSSVDLQGNVENLRNFNAAAIQLAEGKINVEEFTHAMEKMSAAAQLENMDSYFANMAEAFGMSDDDVELMQDYATHIMDIAESSAEFSDELSTNADSAAELAVEITRMNKGVKKLTDGFEGWSDVLKNSSRESQEYAEALSGMKDALADILDINEDLLSENFVVDNLPLIEKAAEGSAEAIDELTSKLDEEIILNITAGQTDEFISKVTAANDVLQGMEWPDIEVGAILNDQQFLDAANELVNTAGMTADEANAYFAGIGYEPVYNAEDIPTDTTIPNGKTKMAVQHIGWNTASIDILGTSLPISLPNITYTTESIADDPTAAEGNMRLVSFSGDGKPPQIKGLRKKASGSANNYSGVNKGDTGTKSSGGGSKPKPLKSTNKSEVVERYKEINDLIDDMTDAYDDASKAADRLYGKDRIAKMQAMNGILSDEIGLLEKKRQEAQDYLDIVDKPNLEAVGASYGLKFEFDKEGNISNYESQMSALYNELHGVEESVKEGGVTSEEQELIDAVKEKIEAVEGAIQQYDDTRELITDLDKDIQDTINKIQDTNYEIMEAKLDLDLAVQADELERIEYYLDKISDDFYHAAEGAAYLANQIDLSKENIKDYRWFIGALAEEYNTIDEKTGQRKISQADYIEGLKETRSAIYDELNTLNELDDEMLNYYGDTLSGAQEELSTYTDRMEHLNSVLDHYQNLMEITGKSTNYENLTAVLQGQADLIKNSYEVSKANYEWLKSEADDLKVLMDEAQAAGNTAAYEGYRNEWLAAQAAAEEAQDEMLSQAAEWAEAMKTIVSTKLEELSKVLEESLTADFGSFDELSKNMERASSLQEEYLTTTNKIYETTKLMRTAQGVIDTTTNTVAKQRLKSYIEETAQLQNKNKLSQYELEIQQAKYDLLLAEIALEEAQNAKSTVTLRRDSEGNFGYVYTADQDQIASAEQELEDAQNRLYNIGLEGANDYTQKYQETLNQMHDEISELTQAWLDGEIESEQEYHAKMQDIKDFYYEKLKDYSELYQVAISTDSAIVAEAWSTEFASMTNDTENWMTKVDEYVGGCSEVFQEWQSTIAEVEQMAGQDLDNLATGVSDITTESDKLVEAITKKDGVLDTLAKQLDGTQLVTDAYIAQRDALQEVISEMETYLRTVDGMIAAESGQVNSLGTSLIGNNSSATGNNSSSTGNNSTTDTTSNSNTTTSNTDITSTTNQNNGDDTLLNNSDKAEGVAAAIWLDGSSKSGWGQGDTRFARFKEKGVSEAQSIINNKSGELYNKYKNKKLSDYYYDAFDTGGYTGEWGSYGKLAMLHEKELILNQDDTANFLASIDILRNIVKVLDLQAAYSQLDNQLSSPGYYYPEEESILEQNVHIEASFPNVENRSEIEEAFNNLINQASQYANRKR